MRFKLRPDTQQLYEHITYENIRMEGGEVFDVRPWTQFFDLKGLPPPARTVNNVTLRDITGEYRSLGVLRGNPGDTLRDITLENIDVKLGTDRGADKLVLGTTENLVLKNVVVNGKPYVVSP